VKRPVNPEMTLYGALQTSARAYPNRPAVSCGTETLSYHELARRVTSLAGALQRLGVRRGEKVAIILPNCLEYVYAFYAPGALGAAIVPINYIYRQKEIQHILADSEVVAVIADPKPLGNDVEAILAAVRPSLPNLRHVIFRGKAVEGCSQLESIMAEGGSPSASDASPDDLWALIYTSGTTGVPKAVMQSHRAVLSAAVQADAEYQPPLLRKLWTAARLVQRHGLHMAKYAVAPPTMLSPAPLHALLGYSVLSGLLGGYRVVLADRFHPARVLELVEQEKVNAIVVAPTMLNALLHSPELQRRNLTSLILVLVSAALCPPELARRAREAFNCPVYIAFGATEIGGAPLTTNPFDADVLQTETVGRLLPGSEAKIVDDQRRTLPPGQVGELAFRLKSNMLGYYKAESLTAQTMDADGWYYTGDLATIDQKGYVRIAGRRKDMIIRAGQNVFPAEIEAHLLNKQEILNAAVVGVPDDLTGERVWAFVAPVAGAALTATDVWDHCRRDLAAFKVPDQVRVVAELPLTSTGKVQKYLLRQMAQQELMAGAGLETSA
jgi:fatty-acyl-CoA synthase